MIVLVKWHQHDRQYTIGIRKFLKELNLDVNDAQIQSAIKHLLEQEEMTREL
jgi:hypothetical protein